MFTVPAASKPFAPVSCQVKRIKLHLEGICIARIIASVAPRFPGLCFTVVPTVSSSASFSIAPSASAVLFECLLNCKRRTPCGGESKSNRLQVCILIKKKKKLEQQYIVAEKSNFKHSFLFYLSFLPIIAPTCPTVPILSYNSWGMLCS